MKPSEYEKIEQQRYEGFWRSLKGGFSANPTHYSSASPDPVVMNFIQYAGEHLKTSGATVVDLGCGNGRHVIEFSKRGYNTIGIDIAGPALAIAREWAKKEGLSCRFIQASVLQNPLKTGEADIVIDTGCLHHLRKQQWKRYLRELARIIKPGGFYLLLYFSVNSGYLPKFTPLGNRQWRLRHGHFSRYATKKELVEFFADTFKVRSHAEIQKQASPLKFHVLYLQKK